MPRQRERNPYETLRLRSDASIEDVIRRCQELSRETMDTGEQIELRRAAEEVRQHPVRRARNQFWEPPESQYEDDELESFCRQHRRPPVTRRHLRASRDRFVEQDCSPDRLIGLALPWMPILNADVAFSLEGAPLDEPDLTLEPRELFT